MRNFLEIIFKRQWQILTIFVCCLIFVLIGNFLATPLYESEATMLVRMGREATVPPTAMTQPLNLFYTRTNQINSQMQILKSRYLVELAIDNLSKDILKLTEPKLQSLLDWVRYLVKTPVRWVADGVTYVLASVGLMNKLTKRQAMVLYFQKNIAMERIKDTDVIQVTFIHPNPEFAKKFLAEFLETFLKASNTAMAYPGSMDFFSDQFRSTSGELGKAEEEMAAYRRRFQIYDLRVQKENTARELTRIGTDLRANQLEATSISAKLDRIKVNPRFTIESELPVEMRNDQSMIEMLKSLGQLKVRQNQMRENLTPGHPDMVALQGELNRIRGDIQREARGILESQLATLEKKDQELLEQELLLTEQAQNLDERGIELNQYERRVDQLKKDYQIYAEKQEILRIDQSMDQKRLTSVAIVQPPLMPFKPLYPRKGLNLLLGLFVGATLGIAYAFTSEHFAGTVNHPEVLASQLGTTFVVSVPDLSQPKDSNGGSLGSWPNWGSFRGLAGEKKT